MADKTGYIGRNPADAAVTIARQKYEPTSNTTEFTLTAGYTPGYVDAYLNGARLIEGSDYTAGDGSTVGLTTHAQNGDVLELVAYKAFNLGQVIESVTGNFTVSNDLTVTNGDITASNGLGTFADVNVSGTTTTGALVVNGVSIAGTIGANGYLQTLTVGSGVTFEGPVSIAGTLTYEDVTNVDSVGIVTAQAGVRVLAGGIQAVGLYTGLSVSGVGTFSTELQIADYITHSGDDNTKFGFDTADNIVFRTSGAERLRVYSDGNIGIGTAIPNTLFEVASATPIIRSTDTDAANDYSTFQNDGGISVYNAVDGGSAGSHAWQVAGTEKMRLKSNGYLGINTSVPDQLLSIRTGGDAQIALHNASGATKAYVGTAGGFSSAGTDDLRIRSDASNIVFGFSGAEVARLTSSNTLGIGTATLKAIGSTTAANREITGTGHQITVLSGYDNSISGPSLIFGHGRGAIGAVTIVQDGDNLGDIRFAGTDGADFQSEGAKIKATVDGPVGVGSMPTSLILGTTNRGAETTTDRLTIGAGGDIHFANATICEKFHNDTGGGITGSYNHDVLTYGMVWYGATNSAGTYTFNLRGSSTITFNSLMAVGETTVMTLYQKSGNTSHYMTAFNIDGSAPTIEWAGGSAPSAGQGSGTDVYSITILKTANATFMAYASLTEFG